MSVDLNKMADEFFPVHLDYDHDRNRTRLAINRNAIALARAVAKAVRVDTLRWAADDCETESKRLCDGAMLDPDIQILQNAASQARAFASAKNSAWRLCLAHAVLYLARACKSRINDEFQAVVTLGRLAGDKREIPDVALDKHTLRGKMQNRGMEHFLKEGCKLENEDPANNTYRERAENLWMRLDKDKDLAQKYSDEGNRVRPNRETDPDE